MKKTKQQVTNKSAGQPEKKADIKAYIKENKVSIIVPEEYMGDVMGDLNGRRGQITGMETRGGASVIDAFVPLSEMFGYATNLRGRSQGRGQFSMQPSHYTEVPKNIAEKIISGGRF